MTHAIKININPFVLSWAREEAGYKTDEVADKLNIKQERYISWEKDGREIPLGLAKVLANYYKRQLAVFFLPTPPPKIKKPSDFRNLALSKKGLSPETLLAIRRTNKYLQIARNILGSDYFLNYYSWLQEIKGFSENDFINIEKSIELIRGKLKIDIEQQYKFKNYEDAFKNWRNSIERELGIFVFQFPMPVNELDGFSYAEDTPPYAIVINSNNKFPQRKIFTLFHELSHIIKHKPGICLQNFTKEKRDFEFLCNEFAGKFLVPDDYVFPINGKSDLAKFAKKFKVSCEVYLRRNFERHFISQDEFYRTLAELKSLYIIPPKDKTKKIIIDPVTKSKSSRGNKFFDLVLNAVSNNRIDYTTASDALNIKINYISNEL